MSNYASFSFDVMDPHSPCSEEMNDSPENEIEKTPESPEHTSKKVTKRGRRPSKVHDVKAKLERSRQSARECRARKKLRYQYIEELVADREKAVHALRHELEMYKKWSHKMDQGTLPPDAVEKIVKDQYPVRSVEKSHRSSRQNKSESSP